MKVAILAGGYGKRLLEETKNQPKAMVEIGGRPIIWHLFMLFAHHGFNHFVLALGYKAEQIQAYLSGLGRITELRLPEMQDRALRICTPPETGWTIDLVETGLSRETGGRIRRIAPLLQDETFMLTWCDGLADIDLRGLVAFHQAHDRLATVTAVHPPARFGRLILDGDRVVKFSEKAEQTDIWINGAFFVLEPGVFDYIDSDDVPWEKEPMERLARDGQLKAYRHDTFWQCMDTIYERQLLQNCWENGHAPWKVWDSSRG